MGGGGREGGRDRGRRKEKEKGEGGEEKIGCGGRRELEGEYEIMKKHAPQE